MVDVAQSEEFLAVNQEVAGSRPVVHPKNQHKHKPAQGERAHCANFYL